MSAKYRRTNTIEKYMNAAFELRRMCRNGEHIHAHEFCAARKIDRGFVSHMQHAGFISRLGRQRYQWMGKPIVESTIETIFMAREGRYGADDSPAQQAELPLAPTIDTRTKDPEPESSDTARINALEQRVANLERLLVQSMAS